MKRLILVSLFAVVSCRSPQNTSTVAAPATPHAVWTTKHFNVTSSAPTNLYHLLLNWALFETGKAPPWAPIIEQREQGLKELTPQERLLWNDAVQTFATRTSGRSILFDEGLIAVRAYVAEGGPKSNVPKDDLVLLKAIDSVWPIYTSHWWPEHHAMNVAWVEALLPALRTAESTMTQKLAAAFGGTWPSQPIAIDVSVHVVPNGAYSTAGRVTITSLKKGYRMPQALEMVLHEASHLGPLESNLRSAIEIAFKKTGRKPPERLWHDLIFYTSGEIAKGVYADVLHTPGVYQHYGQKTGVYQRGKARWQTLLPILEKTWRPFIESGSGDARNRQEALQALARALPRPQTGPAGEGHPQD